MSDANLSRREREKLRQRQDMLDAALSLFAEKGYHNVSMQEIAEAAEFATGTLYKFFDNKEDLYKALVLEQTEKFKAILMAVLEEPADEIEKLKRFVRARGDICRDNLPFVRLFLAESKGASFNLKAGLDADLRGRIDAVLKQIALVFESGIRNGRFVKIADPYALALALDGVIDTFLLRWLEDPEKYPFPEDPDFILNLFFKALLATP